MIRIALVALAIGLLVARGVRTGGSGPARRRPSPPPGRLAKPEGMAVGVGFGSGEVTSGVPLALIGVEELEQRPGLVRVVVARSVVAARGVLDLPTVMPRARAYAPTNARIAGSPKGRGPTTA
jgi:hypothetical protein